MNSFINLNKKNKDLYISKDVLNRIIIVGATKNKKKNNYTTYSFSNYGENVDIWAPGTGIYSTVPVVGYFPFDGTSMAAPMVSGVVALAWGANPALSGPELFFAIRRIRRR